MPSERELIRHIQEQAGQLAQAVADAAYWHGQVTQAAEDEHNRRTAEAEAAHQRATAQAAADLDAATQRIQQRAAQSDARHRQMLDTAGQQYQSGRDAANAALNPAIAGRLFAPWSAGAWSDWTPPAPGDAAPAVSRLGTLTWAGAWHPLRFPALIPLIGGRSLLVKTAVARRNDAAAGLQSLLTRLLAAIPPGKLRFTFVDPVGLGQNVASFMHLADSDEQLVTGKAWTEPHHIEQRLADLTEHMENVIQKYLRNQFKSIEDYNAQAGEVAEPYRALAVFDFPANFTEAAARRLVSIAQNGPRCGVYTVILADAAKPMPYGFNLADLEQNMTVVAWDGGRWVWQDDDFKDCQLDLDAPPGADLFERIVRLMGEAAKAAGNVEVPFERIAPPPERWWTGDSRAGITVPLGPAGARKSQLLDLGKNTAQHVLIAGKTGSGKSTLLHTLITNLALTYSPDEVELYLIDFKKGVEFKPYAARALPHARVIAIESEREFGLSVLQGMDAELKRRGDLLRTAGVDSLAAYRAANGGRKLPRILLLVDEFQEFFTEDDPVASQSAQVLDRLVRQGRAFGIHVLLGSQTLAGAYSLARSTIDQMAVRIALQCSEADSRLILADDNPAARLLSRPGEAIYNASNGTVEGNNRFQVAWLPDDQRDRYLDDIRARADAGRPPRPQIVFEGNAPADVSQNTLLRTLLAAPLPSLSSLLPPLSSPAWLGDPIAIRGPISAAFKRQSGANLLMVGQNDDAALALLVVAAVSLAAGLPAPAGAGGERLLILDFGATDGPHAGLFDRLAEQLPGLVRVGRRRQMPEVLNDLAADLQQRMDAERANGPARFLLVHGLQRARDLRQEDSFSLSLDSAPGAPSPAQQFATLLREGPDVGLHTLVWCDTMTNLNRALDRRALREFGLRVAFQMSAEDSSNLIDTPAAAKLGPNRALLYSEDEGRLEKFRPYGVPSAEWLAGACESLRRAG